MEIRAYTAAELNDFIRSESFKTLPVIPISRHRAASHTANPRLDPADQIMFIAWEGEALAGYLGVFADRIYLNDQPEKAGWLSCMWVDPNMRGKGIAKKLLRSVLDSWGNRILVTEFTPAAKGLYDRSETFMDLKKPVGMRGYLRANLAYLLPRRKPGLAGIKPLLRLTDGLLNLFNGLRLRLWTPKMEGLNWTYIAEIDAELDAFIRERQAKQFTRRTAEDLNWMLRHPWVLTAPEPDADSVRYHFSAVDTRFEFLAMRLTRADSQLAGLLILQIRGGHLKVPYAYVEQGLEHEAVQLIYRQALALKADMVSIWHPGLVAAMQAGGHPFYLRRQLQRHFITSKVFGEAFGRNGEVEIQDGDADAAFT
ncbi:MAG: GNAT family N-acetyltransferase [Bacteroidota bacterium]